MGRGIILVRHAMPDVQPGVASKLWGLGERGREDCVLLAHALPAELAPVVFSSPEPKASQTAAVVALRKGLEVEEASAFVEVDRPPAWDDDYQYAAMAYLRAGIRDGWEPAARVVGRFRAGIHGARDRYPDSDLVVTTHGLAMSVYLASVAPIDVAAFWLGLTLPDAWRFDAESAQLTRLFNAGLRTG